MGTFFEKNWFKLALGAILIAMIASFAYKLWANGSEPDERLTAMKQAPSFQLQDLDGKTVASQVWMARFDLYISFIPSAQMCACRRLFAFQVQEYLKKKDLLGTKAEIVSITVDPKRDTPEVLKEFGNRFESKPVPGGWTFLRGEESKIHKLAEDFGIMVIKEKDGNFSHSNAILLVDPKGKLRNYYDASNPELDVDHIVKDVVTLSKGK